MTAMIPATTLLQVHQQGPQTVVGFRDNQPGPFFDWSALQPELMELLDETGCRRLAWDLTDFDTLSSSLLQLLIAPYHRGVDVSVVHPSQHLREILHRTRLDRLIRVIPDAGVEVDTEDRHVGDHSASGPSKNL